MSFSPEGAFFCYPKVKNSSEHTLVIYDPSRRIKLADLENAGIWWSWDEDESRLLWVKRPGQIVISNIANNKDEIVYDAKEERGITTLAWLQNNKIGFIEGHTLKILDLQNGNISLIDDDVNYFTAVPNNNTILYISDYNFILLSEY